MVFCLSLKTSIFASIIKSDTHMENHEAKFSVIRKYYTDHMHELRVFVNNRIHDAEVADDIVQNVFIRLLSIDGIVNSDTLSNLVHAIARNLICDHYRHKRYEDEYTGYVCSKPGCEMFCASQACSVDEIREILECGMERLNEKQRIIYRMNVYDGLAVSEISETLNMNYKSVENRLGLARKEMRKYMTRMLA